MPLKKLKSDLPTGRYADEVTRTQRTLCMLDDFYGFHVIIIFTYSGEVKNAMEIFKI